MIPHPQGTVKDYELERCSSVLGQMSCPFVILGREEADESPLIVSLAARR